MGPRCLVLASDTSPLGAALRRQRGAGPPATCRRCWEGGACAFSSRTGALRWPLLLPLHGPTFNDPSVKHRILSAWVVNGCTAMMAIVTKASNRWDVALRPMGACPPFGLGVRGHPEGVATRIKNLQIHRCVADCRPAPAALRHGTHRHAPPGGLAPPPGRVHPHHPSDCGLVVLLLEPTELSEKLSAEMASDRLLTIAFIDAFFLVSAGHFERTVVGARISILLARHEAAR